MNFLFFLLFSLIKSEKIITNIKSPSCKNCKYYKPSLYNTDFTASYNECIKFGIKDIITDKLSYDYADSCRKDESKCGKEGKYFEEEKNLNIKILKHKFISNIPNNLLTIIVLLILFQNYIKK